MGVIMKTRDDPKRSNMLFNRIMSRKRLAFNPYSVCDHTLLNMVSSIGWGCSLDLTQMVVMTFLRLRKVKGIKRYDGVFVSVSDTHSETFIPIHVFSHGVTAADSLYKERSWIGKKCIRHPEDIEKLVGSKVFISRTIIGHDIAMNNRVAYRMHRLKGKIQEDAEMIRISMIDSKIEMLERLLKYPEYLLDCRKGIINYESRVESAINIIKNFKNNSI